MTADEESRIVALMRAARAKSRGYADFFLWSIDRDMEEWGIVTSLAETLEKEKRGFFTALRRRGRGNDPPDLEATDLSGSRLAIEVTELVDEAAIKSFKAGREYDWASWDQLKFAAALNAAVSKKDEKYPKLKGGPYPGGYVVVVHTDEPELRFEACSAFVRAADLVKPKYLTRAFLLLSYDPSQGICPCIDLQT